jgi:transposase
MSKSHRITKRGRHAQQRARIEGSLPVLRPHAAGIDVGSEEHYVSVSPDQDPEPVRRFGCYTSDLRRMAEWLKACRIETVAMEATGVYWVPVFEILEEYGFEVYLVDARQTKNVSGRKTDVVDCQWIRQLHTYGLLTAAFRPEQEIAAMRAYWRQRQGLVESCSRQIHLMQKALEQMNVQLHKAVSDIAGLTGLSIIRRIVAGERDAQALAKLRQKGVKRSEAEIAEALNGNYRGEHVFALAQALESYDFFQGQMERCDGEIQQCMSGIASKTSPPMESKPAPRRRWKNQPHFDLRAELHRVCGVDLTRIESIDAVTAQTVISECGIDMARFPSEKNFASWLAVCPNNRKTGGRIRSTRTRRLRKNRAADALRRAAQSLHHSKSALGAQYRHLRARLGAPKAITAMAHKLARLIYRLLKYGEAYVSEGLEQYEARHRERALRSLRNHAQNLGYHLVSQATGEVVS